jgi:hypothetical protein
MLKIHSENEQSSIYFRYNESAIVKNLQTTSYYKRCIIIYFRNVEMFRIYISLKLDDVLYLKFTLRKPEFF